jgi:murein DD-endopeptidase MepM/ murein hydrolase activator NlpD
MIKTNHDISLLLSETLNQNKINNLNLDKMGLDLRGIQAEGNASKEAQIKRIAVQFEQMLINSLLKDAFPEKEEEENNEESLLHFAPVRDFRIMLLSQHISDNGGLGYQEIIEQQLKETYLNRDNDTTKIENPVTKSLQSLPVAPAKTQANPTSADDKNAYQYKDINRKVQPVESEISSDFGWRIDPIDGKTRFHNGIDFEVPANTPIKSFMAGEVVFSGWEKGYGYMIEIKHPNGYSSRYGHNSKLLVQKGDKVEAGTVIARSGSTGRSTGPHLHFEVRKGNLTLNPVRILKHINPGLYANMK